MHMPPKVKITSKRAKRKPGKPSIFTEKMAKTICAKLMDGQSLRSICLDPKMPSKTTIFKWLADPVHSAFNDQYVRAREEQTETLIDEIIDLADNAGQPLMIDGIPIMKDGKPVLILDAASVNHARLMVDTRKWYAGKLKPKKYGERQVVEHEVSSDTVDRIMLARKRAIESKG